VQVMVKKLRKLMNKRKKIIIIVIIIFILIILLIISYKTSESYIRKQIERANYCSTKDDCTLISGKCPFDCNIYINKNEVLEIQNLIKFFDSYCMYKCMICKEFDCVNNKCVQRCSLK